MSQGINVAERDAWVDYAKAIGIILVVYGHVARGIYSAGIPFDATIFRLADSVIYSFHMPLFFFLSGLFFCNSLQRRGGLGMVAGKVDTIIYPFVLWSILQGLAEAFLSAHTNGSVDFASVFTMLWAPRAHFWFLYALFALFVFSALFYSLIPRRTLWLLLAVSLLGYFFQGPLSFQLVVGYISKNLVFFVFGILFSRMTLRGDPGSTPALFLMTGLFAGSQFLFHGILGLNYEDKGAAALVVALVSILFIVSLSYRLARTSPKGLALLGASSMGIYLMHVLAGSGTRVVLKNFMGIEALTVHLLAGCLAGLLVPTAVMLLVRRYRIPFVISAPVSQAFARFRPAPLRKLPI
jgi:fucose 4-O-acetylase-like acetyltransferase